MKFFKIFKRNNQRLNEAPAAFKTGRAGALFAAKPKRTLFTVLAAALFCVCLAVTGVGLSFLNANALSTDSTYIVLNDGDESSWGNTYKNNITALYKALGGKSCNTYSLLLDKVNSVSRYSSGKKIYGLSSSEIRSNNAFGSGNVRVRFGGYDWLVGFVSIADRTTDGTSSANGHLIATLVRSDTSGGYIQYAKYNKGGKNYTYPSTMYSCSYVRSYLTGSRYATSESSCSTTGTSNIYNNGNGSIWQTFTNTYSSYLVQPKYVLWQEYQDAQELSEYSYSCPNDSYSTTNSFNLQSGYNFISRSSYGDWKNDYIWLPSGSELDSYQTQNGLFNADDNFLSASTKYWMRSGRCASSVNHIVGIGTSGTYSNSAANVSDTYSVRPAIHLDLYALDQRTTNSTNEPVTPYWTASQANYYRYSDNILYGSYTGEKQTATMYYPEHVGSPYTGNLSSTLSGTTRTFTPGSANVTIDTSASSDGETHDYRYTYLSPSSGYYWSGGTRAAQYYSIKLYRAVLSIGLNSTSFTYNGSAQGPTITSISAKSAAASKVNKTVASAYLPAESDLTIYYYGTTATGAKYGDSSSPKTTAPTEVGNYYVRVVLDATNNYRTNFTLNEAYAAPNNATSVNTYRRAYAFTITYGDITTYSATALNGTYNGSPQSLITGYSATVKTTPQWTFSTTSSSSGFSSTVPTATNAGTYTVWCKITASYYNTRVFSKTATIGKKNLTISWNPSGTGAATYTYNGGGQGPTATYSGLVGGQNYSPTVYYNGSTTKPTAVGSYTASVKNTAPTANYTVAASSKPFTINKANITSVSVSPYNGTYDGTAHNAVNSYSATTKGNQAQTWYWGTSSNPTSTAIPKLTNYTAGTTIYYKITAPNHNDYTGSVVAKVNKKNLTVVWNPAGTGTASYTYNGSPQGPTATYSGLISGQNYSPTVYYNGSTTKPTNAGSYTASVNDTAPSANYTVTASTKSFTINGMAITSISVTPYNGTYDGSAHNAVTYSATTKGGQSKTWYWSTTSSTSGFSTTIPTVKNYTAGTTVWYYVTAANHNNSAVGSVIAKVNKKNLTVKWTPSGTATYTYDGNAHGPTAEYSGLITGENHSPTVYYGGKTSAGANWGSTTSNKTKPTAAGTYTAAVTATAPNSNYSVTASTKSFTISRKDISSGSGIEFSLLPVYFYSGNENKPMPEVTHIGYFPVNSAGMFSYAYKDNKNAGTATVTVTGLTSGNYSGSYDLTFPIEKAVITGVEWDKTQFTYTGAAQCPALTKINTTTDVISSAKPLSMFEITGGQVNAGAYTVTAKIKPEYTANFIAAEEGYTASYNIQKAVISLIFTVTEKVYNGTALSCDYTYSVPDTVIAAASPSSAAFELSYAPKSGSHTTRGLAVDAGSYVQCWTINKDFAKNFTFSSTSQDVSKAYSDLVIKTVSIGTVWSSTDKELAYNGFVQGPEVAAFSNIPANGSDPHIGLIVTYYGGNVALTGKPVHVGDYKVVVAITDTNYVLTGGEAAFKITPVKYTDHADLFLKGDSGLVFTGKPQGPFLPSALTGAFTGADDNRTLDIALAYKTNDGAALEGRPTLAGSYVMTMSENFGDYLFDDVVFDIAKREVTVSWSGDNLSKTVDGTIQWLYDGEEHKPNYMIDFGGVDIFRDGKKIESLKINYASRTAIGTTTTAATLAQDLSADGTDYNANFVIAADAPECVFEVIKFIVTEVKWYEFGAIEAVPEENLDKLIYEYTSVYGANGPQLSAYACGVFAADSGDLSVTIPLNVTYPKSYTNYWWNGSEERYEAHASFFSKDSAHCEFDSSLLKESADGTDKVFVTFLVTNIRTNLLELTVVWKVDGVNIDDIGSLNDNLANGIEYGWVDGVFTFIYNGKNQYPVPTAVDNYGRTVAVKVLSSGINKNVGSYKAILAPLAAYKLQPSDNERAYVISAREITLKWDENTEFVYNGVEQYPAATVESGALLEGHTLAYGVDGFNAGEHTVTASVLNADKTADENYEINCPASALKITPKPVSANDIEWTAKDTTGDFVWNYDGKSHCPEAKLFTTVNESKVELKLYVMGGAAAVGNHVAYAILDPFDASNANFTLVESETNPVSAIATRTFEISKITLAEIKWFAQDGADESEDIVYIYNGEQRLPKAVGVTADGTEIPLQVFGARINAGKYTALVLDDYGLAEGVERSKNFTILPKPVTIAWQKKDENGEIHFTYNGREQRPAVTIDGLADDDFAVKGFVNAGSYVAEVVFLNANYTADGENSCEFIIDRAVVKLSWTAEQSYTPSDAEDGVLYWRYNALPHGPVASGSFENIRFGVDKEYRIIISDKETSAGRYTAYATLDYGFAGNANFVLENTEKTYVITPYELRVNWTGNVTDYEEGDSNYGKIFRWTFDGTTAFAPTAKYTLWDGTEVQAEVYGARVSAGTECTASVSLPENCVFAVVNGKSCGVQTFEVLKRKIDKIVWFDKADGTDVTSVKNFAYDYDGSAHLPVAIVDGTGAELIVTGARINAGNGYIATAAIKDAGNYEFADGVNSTYTFGINPMEVWVLWVDNSDTDLPFEWTYTGNFICPEAVLADSKGNPILDNGEQISVTVTGGRIVAGNNYQAIAQNTFTNYKFADNAILIRPFKIKPVSLGADFDWTYDSSAGTKTEDADGNVTFTYAYNGTARQPFAVCNNSDTVITFTYTITNADGEVVDAMINVGEYTLSVKSTDDSFNIPTKTVKVVIEAMTVEVKWGETSLAYDGTARVPEAWYVDAYGQTIALKVTGGVETGSGSATAAMFEADNAAKNYVLDAATQTKDFTVAEKHFEDFIWVWKDDNEGEWTNGVALIADKRKTLSDFED